jgi:hypothetical protein
VVISALSRQPQHTLVKGRNGAGPCTLPSGRVGETVLGVVSLATASNDSANFESTISAAGQIQQTSALNLSGNEYWVVTYG